MKTITEPQPQLKCAKCGYEWTQRTEHTPKECPDCKSRYWKEKKER